MPDHTSDHCNTQPQKLKQCRCCNKWLPATSQYFDTQDWWYAKDVCTACDPILHFPGIDVRTEYVQDSDGRWCVLIRCQHCKEYKTPDNFHGAYKQGICKDCRREVDRRRFSADPEGTREKQRARRRKRPELYRTLYRVNGAKREAKKRSLPSFFTAADERRALEYFNGCCAVCGRPLADLFGEHIPAMDHWIALSDPRPDNPGTVPSNMVPLCHGINGCNNKKSNRDPLEWLREEYGPQRAGKIIRRIKQYFKWAREQSETK